MFCLQTDKRFLLFIFADGIVWKIDLFLRLEDEVVSIGDSCSDNDTDENRHSPGENQNVKNGYDHPSKKLKMVN